MNLTDIFTGGPTQAKWKELGKFLKASRIIGGVGVRVSVDPVMGTVISAPVKHAVTTGQSSHPFQVLNATTELDGMRVYVRPGILTSSFGWSDAPSNMVIDDAADEDKLYLPVAESGYVILQITITTAETPAVADVTVSFVATIPADTATVASIVIGKVTVETVESELVITHIFQNVNCNLGHSLAFEYFSYPDLWRQLIGPINAQITS